MATRLGSRQPSSQHGVDRELLSSTDVAELLGVSPTSVKRWSDEGLLPCLKTSGKHRRFQRTTVEQFRDALTGLSSELVSDTRVEAWIAALEREEGPRALEARMLSTRTQLRSWSLVADFLGEVLHELGAKWARGELSVLAEHAASERIERAVERICEWQPEQPNAPRAILAAAAGDEHTLGLSLVELGLRELSWTTTFFGRATPVDMLVKQIADGPAVQLVALSASALSQDREALSEQAEEIGEACRARGVRLLLGGAGAWPGKPSYGARVHSIAAMHGLLS